MDGIGGGKSKVQLVRNEKKTLQLRWFGNPW